MTVSREVKIGLIVVGVVIAVMVLFALVMGVGSGLSGPHSSGLRQAPQVR